LWSDRKTRQVVDDATMHRSILNHIVTNHSSLL
jgi:hypothetical protein